MLDKNYKTGLLVLIFLIVIWWYLYGSPIEFFRGSSQKWNKRMIYFYRLDCYACKQFRLEWDHFYNTHRDIEGVLIGQVNTDEEPSAVRRFGVKNVPTVITVVNGKIMEQKTGQLSFQELRKMFVRLMTKY